MHTLASWKTIVCSVGAISLGASLGAVSRWVLGILLNHLLPALPPGTLAANFLGSFVAGFGLIFFTVQAQLAPEWRLLLITGFAGGLSTFSAFAAEMLLLVQKGSFIAAALGITAHVAGSMACVFLGMAACWLLFGK